ncbi:MAG: M66 family metalloprotease [Candidatus Thorarchaeota archaeon]
MNLIIYVRNRHFRSLFIIIIGFCLIAPQTGFVPPETLAIDESSNSRAALEFDSIIIPEVFEYRIDIILLGFNDSMVDKDAIVERLPSWYAPVDGMYWRMEYDTNFTIQYETEYRNSTAVDEYRSFLEENSEEDLAPLFIQPEYHTANYIHSELVESYLAENVSDGGASATFVIIDTYSFNPSGHSPYYYNATYNELDAEIEQWTVNPTPAFSTYQIAGGGENTRLLWLDLSAGPTVYHDSFETSDGGVEEILPIWGYEGLVDADEQLEDDLVKYIARVVETRFVPSIDYRAGYAYEEVEFEVLLIDLALSEFNPETRIHLDYMVSEYSRYIPFIEWTYSVSEWDWQTDQVFCTTLNNSMDEYTMTYDPRVWMEFFDDNFVCLFSASTKDKFIIPIFLVMISAEWNLSPDWGGWAREVDGEFAYIYGNHREDDLDPSNKERTELIPLEGLELPAEYVITTGGIMSRISDLDVTIDVHNGTFNVYLVDEYGLEQFNQGYPVDNLLEGVQENLTNSLGTIESNYHVGVYGNYTLIIENLENSTSSIDITLTISSDINYGYTWKIMHEIGHALGLNHPHDAYSWGNYDHPQATQGIYLNWLWDMSYTQMNYANQAPTISLMDIDTLQREVIPRYWHDLVANLSVIADMAIEEHDEIPQTIESHLLNAYGHYNESVVHYSDYTSLDNYNESLRLVFEMRAEMESAVNAIFTTYQSSTTTSTTVPSGLPVPIVIGAVAVIAIALPIGYIVFRRRRLS